MSAKASISILSNLGTNATIQKTFVPFSSKQKKEDWESFKKRFEKGLK
jgi:hypothetical protein